MDKAAFHPDLIVSRKKEVDARRIAGEVVFMDAESGNYYSLNNTASRIWEVLENSHTVSEIVRILMQEYEVDETRCYGELVELLSSLNQQGLISIQ
jgi:hypothetical protein